MKKNLLALFILSSLLAKSQAYNNEWIDYNKTYYEFRIGDSHLFRISQPTLASLGLQNVPAEQFQLWRQGVELPIYTSVQTGVLGVADYIEFNGEYCKASSDNGLFRDPDFQLNYQYSLYSDTLSYFLTVNPVGNNLRLAPTINNIAGNTLAPEPYFIHDNLIPQSQKINPGIFASVGSTIWSSAYDQGEGFTSQDIAAQTVLQDNRFNLNVYTGTGAPQAIYKLNAAGNAQNPRVVRVIMNNTVLVDKVMDFFDYIKLSIPVNLSLISSGTANINIINDGNQPNDKMVVAYSELIYPRKFDFGNVKQFFFQLPANANGNYLEITNFNYNGVAPILYDFTNGKRYVADISNPSLIKVALLPSAVNRNLGLMSQASDNRMEYISSLEKRNFIDFSLPANQGNYLIISNKLLTNGSGGINPVEDYRIYRSSGAGGGFIAKTYMIDELEDQFAFGITKHPLAIRNFLRYARNKFSTVPIRDAFLIGKGVQYDQIRYQDNLGNPDIAKLNMVPTWGRPASDILLAAETGNDIPLTPIGRLSVVKADEVTTYLNKVKEYEQAQKISSPLIADKAWMKNVVHLVGASDQNLQTILDFDMNKYKTTIKDTFYGANVHTFSKTSTDPVEQSNNIRLQNLFHEGLGVVTYFGHSSATTLEYNLDDPQTYNNQGKYPLFIFLGCNAGNFFNFNLARLATNETISEKYVLAKDRGGIASFASTSLGIVHYLDIYNTDTYEALSHTKYGKSLGEIMQEGITQTFNITSQNDFYSRLQCEQTTLHGDPAIRLNNFSKPDYVIEDPLVKITPGFISVAQDSFKVSASFLNIGRAINKPIVVEVKRTYPDLTTQVIKRDTISGTRFSDTLNYSIPIVATRDKGANKITITVDADNAVDELYESNNSITKDLVIYEDEARLIYPDNYAIVNQQSTKLIVSTADPFSTSRQYNMEIDTTELFNSPFKVVKSINTIGGTFQFDPGITFQDSTVYYWRVAPTPLTGAPLWNAASFIYLANSETGFNQSHYYQHAKSDKKNILLDPQQRNWVFDSTGHFIFAKNGVFVTATQQEGDLIVSPDGSPYIRSACQGYSLIFNVFDQKTFVPQLWDGNHGGVPPCDGNKAWNYEYSYTYPASRKEAMDFMDAIPNGAFVVVRNILNNSQTSSFINEWKTDAAIYGSSLYDKLKAVGFNAIDSFTSPRAFIYIYQKGNNAFGPVSAVTNGIYDLVSVTKDLKVPDTSGTIISPAFGKARAWKQLKWRGTSSPDVTAGDAPIVDVIGIDKTGIETTLLTGITASQQDYDISTINAAQYPSIKLKMTNVDGVNFTAYQLRYWRVTYDPVPEGAIAPNIFLKVKDTVDVGEPMDFKIAFKNITASAFDSMKIKMIITDKNNLAHIVPIPRGRKLQAVPDTLQIGTVINTSTLSGANTIYLEANPDEDQQEQYHFNNFAFRNLYVKPDSLNPLLDVTFDGSHILNRDIVSSKPDIIVKLKDEAKWMILNDTSLLTLNVRYPNGTSRRIYFNNDTLKFTPAGQAPNPDNTATINFRPFFTMDGEYEMIISAKDRSENAAGNIEYRVIFEVINKPMISNMLNYPNPFTTSTAFVFTITGSEVPQNIKIEIMTITGKIVREITKDELGPLQIGRNITEFKWDGTDQYGSKLANGIYLYRVVTNLNGHTLDKYKAKDDNTDKYFNKGYGKMYLMR